MYYRSSAATPSGSANRTLVSGDGDAQSAGAGLLSPVSTPHPASEVRMRPCAGRLTGLAGRPEVVSLWLIFRPFFFGGWLILLIVLLMLVSLGMRIYMFSRRRRFFNGGGGTRQGPEQILARRFAMGEIDEAEYQRRLAALKNPTLPTK